MYHVDTKTTCDPDDKWLMEFEEKYSCPECRMVFRHVFSQAIDVAVDEHPGVAAMNCVTPPFVDFIRCDFLDLFKDVLKEDIHIGRVFRHGQLLEQYRTFTSENRLIVRGRENVHWRKCPACRGFVYSPGDFCNWYVLSSSLIERDFYISSKGGFIMTEELRSRIEKGKWKGIIIEKIPVLEKPLDGFDQLPKELMFL